MSMPWFRLYAEARNDAKLRALTDAEHRIWFNLLCYASEQNDQRGTIQNYDLDLLSIEVSNGNADALKSALNKLEKFRILRVTDTEIEFINFMDRQYDKPSDNPANVRRRVQKHRDLKRDETHSDTDLGVTDTENNNSNADVTRSNADVTAGNAYTQTQTQNREEKEREERDASRALFPLEELKREATEEKAKPLRKTAGAHDPDGLDWFINAYPEKDATDCIKAWNRVKPTEADKEKIKAVLETFWSEVGNRKLVREERLLIIGPAVFLNNRKWHASEPFKGWQVYWQQKRAEDAKIAPVDDSPSAGRVLTTRMITPQWKKDAMAKVAANGQ